MRLFIFIKIFTFFLCLCGLPGQSQGLKKGKVSEVEIISRGSHEIFTSHIRVEYRIEGEGETIEAYELVLPTPLRRKIHPSLKKGEEIRYWIKLSENPNGVSAVVVTPQKGKPVLLNLIE
ncbi:MAG: hypothetical protein COT91_04545 [Candidatus Doudnabacteria bacterium CG10_big_fil_rev_8_21_14_0_10_41_10]|uniref:Uncharacterized protein n=1 Tax=Candidatus Doudnabacteria bacterium CG10_big_fil_rev_8_21_14_0_10_41_10 TaxID=1974551 RepID=A0A2H0VEX4_9BACT|nr:MAG: hypothetical protein COT91_04545 [Candidatus Doudnabacteria bacterium CG10_big_fil_rev_8_21_14_0_10_41_10]